MNISTVDPEVLLTDYSMVFQDVVLFDDTVMGNIRLGKWQVRVPTEGEDSVVITLILSFALMAALFLMIWAAVALVQKKEVFAPDAKTLSKSTLRLR